MKPSRIIIKPNLSKIVEIIIKVFDQPFEFLSGYTIRVLVIPAVLYIRKPNAVLVGEDGPLNTLLPAPACKSL